MLKQLDLEGCPLSRLPDSLAQLQKLEKLNLSGVSWMVDAGDVLSFQEFSEQFEAAAMCLSVTGKVKCYKKFAR